MPTAGTYRVLTRSATTSAATYNIVVDGVVVVTQPASMSVPTGGWQNWQTFTTNSFNLSAGTHTLRIAFTSINQNLNWLKVEAVGPAVCGNGILETGEACDDGNAVSTDVCTNT